MADEKELCLANLDEFVNDEDKIVTYKWLSRTLSVPANKAKQMLYAFVQKQKSQKSSSQLTITYIVGGRCLLDGDIVQRYVITQDKDLEETKKTFSPVTSLHIYSVQKCRLKDSNSLFTVDYDIQQQNNTEDNRWSHICCSAAKHRSDKGVHRVAHGVNGVANDEKKSSASRTVNGEVESQSSKGASTSVTEPKAKASSSKSKKGQISALEMFASKPTTSKTDKSNIKKEEDVPGDTEEKSKAAQTKLDSNKTGSMKSFFGQSATVKKTSEKPAPTGKSKASEVPKKNRTDSEKQNLNVQSKNQKKREISSDDEEEPLPAKISEAVKASSKVSENRDSKEAKKKVQKNEQEEEKTDPLKSNKTRKKKAVIAESDEETEEKPRKRRKRMKELPKEGSSEDEKEEKVTNVEPNKEVSPDGQESTKSESPLPQQQHQQQTAEKDASRPARKRKKVMKSKTFMNDEGYMVTEKVWESESTDASDDEPQIIIKPPVSREKRPSPVKKTGAKKTHSDMKSKGVKQSSLTNFFKKS